MAERTTITNLLLLVVLTSVLLISGGLQCAFDCLTLAGHTHAPSLRVDDCHPVASQEEPAACCPNKACHQGTPTQHDLEGPQLHALNKVFLPLAGGNRVQLPQLKVGAALQLPTFASGYPSGAALPLLDTTSQQLRSIRTIVLLI